MKKLLRPVLTMLVCGALLLGNTARAGEAAPPRSLAASSTPGLQIAQAITTITGVAISPLLGVGAVGAWKFCKTSPDKRASLPWYARPWFWIPALLLVGLVVVKDVLGTSLPASLKKPFDVLEAFENKISALIAAGFFVPLVASVFSPGGDAAGFSTGAGLAMIEPAALLNVLTIPTAIAAFLTVWLVSHVINVLILISPFGVVDAVLKLARFLLLASLTLVASENPMAGAAFSLVIILVCCLLSGWAFRMTVFGTYFAWDILTLHFRRFKSDANANGVFLARAIEKVPVRTFGKLARDEQGRLVLRYRPWLVLRARTLTLPAGQYAIERGLMFPELVQLEGNSARTTLLLPPRYLSHEADLSRIYGFGKVRDVPVIRGFKATWNWLKDLCGWRRPLPSDL